jgi:hypothetical protein
MLKGAISMCIYCGTTKYRRIYEQHNGPIPKDDNNRSYEIHHIDGNHSNNDPMNLKCVTIQEHYDIHYSQGDYAACLRMSSRIALSPTEISELAKQSQTEKVTNGTHHLLGGSMQRRLVSEGKHHLLSGEIQRKANAKRIAEGTHNFIGPDINKKRVEDRTHHFLGPTLNNSRIEKGTHNFMQMWECETCGKEGKNLASYHRWHGSNCKAKTN